MWKNKNKRIVLTKTNHPTSSTSSSRKNNNNNNNKMIVFYVAIVAVVSAITLPASSVEAWTTTTTTTSTSRHPHPLSSLSSRSRTTTTTTTATATTTQLQARRSKRGSLGTLAKEGLIERSDANQPKRTKRTTTTTTSGSKKTAGGAGKEDPAAAAAASISPALAEWMKNQESGAGTAVPAVPTDSSKFTSSSSSSSSSRSASSSTATFEAFGDDEDDDDEDAALSSKNKMKKGKNNNSVRRVKQSERNEKEEQRQVQIDAAVTALKDALDGTKKNNLDEILEAVRGLVSLPASPSAGNDNPRLLLGGKRRYDYRLAWVGSDDAICHIGTGLHKVPLARLQEIFWSCLGRNRVELLEVIRILGPFPNVRNTLQGNTKLLKASSASNDDDNSNLTTINIVMDSMVDGTGKQIMAGTEDNIRRVDLQLYFADERAMVAVVPLEGGGRRADPLENNGSHVLVFLKEEALDEKLDALRVS